MSFTFTAISAAYLSKLKYSGHCTVYTHHCVLAYSLHITVNLRIVYTELYAWVQCTCHGVLACSVHITVCTVHSVQCTLYTSQCTCIQSTYYCVLACSVHITVCICTLNYSVQYYVHVTMYLHTEYI